MTRIPLGVLLFFSRTAETVVSLMTTPAGAGFPTYKQADVTPNGGTTCLDSQASTSHLPFDSPVWNLMSASFPMPPTTKKPGNFTGYQVGTKQEIAPSRPDFPSRGETSICASRSLSVCHWSRVEWVLQGHILDCLPAKVHLPIGGIEQGKDKQRR